MGPTASGKTAVVLELAMRLPVEIVSVDSAQVYRDMDIGTAKPDRATLERFPHHLIDLISPEESYSAARFRADALRLMAEIKARGRIPLLAGGTMLYFKALREGLSDLPPADPDIRRKIDEDARARGWPALHAELAMLDPASGARLKPNDAQRIQRALEIVRLTGAPLADGFARRSSEAPPYRLIALGLMPSDRAVLHERIARRFEVMLEAGLLDEVAALRRKYRLDANLPSMRCVGYRQAWEFLEGNCDRTTLREKAVAATRQLAKRQMTWQRGMPDVPLLDCLAAGLASRVAQAIEERLAAI
ncbi:MAG: tRNA (adenosine(37)-N6)-dimethylallyltransferase MiaA [Rhodocyclaceae bacterium]|jgi:tRNA dimethylallyltransferase|nr:tRNA (adenosine(37)-N6)-dimethylallyltransferase MiaA [Rhodocyclaceae bacterium]